MNTSPADTRSPHLDLADLIAEVTGQVRVKLTISPTAARLAKRIFSRAPSGIAAIIRTAKTRTRNPAGRLATKGEPRRR